MCHASGVAYPGWFKANLVRAEGSRAILSSSFQFLLAAAKVVGRFDHQLSPGQSSSAHRLCRAGAKDPAFFANPGSGAGGDHLCPVSGECGNGGLDFRAEEHVILSLCPGIDPLVSEV